MTSLPLPLDPADSGLASRAFHDAALHHGALHGHESRMFAVRAVVGAAPVFVGPTAAWAHGSFMGWPGDTIHVNVATPHALVSRSGLVVHQADIHESEIVTTRFGPATSVMRTALDLACLRPRAVALAHLDSLARSAP